VFFLVPSHPDSPGQRAVKRLLLLLLLFSVQNLMIQETSPGVDGQQYTLRFTTEIPDMDIPSFDLSILFYNGLFLHFKSSLI